MHRGIFSSSMQLSVVVRSSRRRRVGKLKHAVLLLLSFSLTTASLMNIHIFRETCIAI